MSCFSETAQYTSNTLINLTVVIMLADGVTPINPTTLVLKVQDPTGAITNLSGAVVNDSTGYYHAPYVPLLLGTYSYEWIATGNVEVATVAQFIVNPVTF